MQKDQSVRPRTTFHSGLHYLSDVSIEIILYQDLGQLSLEFLERAVSPASRFLPASRNSFDQR